MIKINFKYKKECQMIAEFNKDPKKFQSLYDVVINDDGSVYDYIQKSYFDTLLTWAKNVQNLK